MAYEGPIQELIDELARLPGVGPKSAQRLAFWLVKAPAEDAKRLAAAIVQAKDRIAFCRECGNVAEGDLCRVCADASRDATVLCVVEEPKDAATIEKASLIKGRYHILGGAISPLASRVTVTPSGFSSAAMYMAVALPSRLGFVARITSVT